MASTGMRRRRLYSGLALVLIAILFASVVTLSNTLLRTSRADLTEQGLFTLSDGTREVLRQIDEPVTLRFYYSQRITQEIPSVGIYAQRVRDLLEQYAALAGDKIRLEVFDPQPFTDVEDRAVAFGMQGVPVDQGGDLVYFGLAGTNATDDTATIPFFDQAREQFLEYDITKIVHQLAHPEKPKVGLITALPLAGSPGAGQGQVPDDAWTVYRQLEGVADVQAISQGADKLPDNLDLIVLVHAQNLSDETQYALDQYVLGGGKLIVYVDPHAEGQALNPPRGPDGRINPGMSYASGLETLFAAWGITVPADTAAGDMGAARRVQASRDSRTRVAAVEYPLWPAFDAENLNREDVITGELNVVNMASPGHIEKTADSTITIEPLIVTGNRGGTVPIGKIQDRVDPVDVVNSFQVSETPLVLAARLTGDVETAFPDGPPGKDGEAAKPADAAAADANGDGNAATDKAPTRLEASVRPINVIVVADVDLLADGMWVQVQDFFGQRIAVPQANNGDFFVNAIENMVGSSELIGLRSRGVFQRPFTVIQEIQRDAEMRFRAKEQELVGKLRETEEKLKNLRGRARPGGDGTLVVDEEQRAEIEKFRAELLQVRRELRDVQFALRHDVENLRNWIRAINIGLIPVLVAIVALVLAAVRRSIRRRPQRA